MMDRLDGNGRLDIISRLDILTAFWILTAVRIINVRLDVSCDRFDISKGPN